MGNDDSDTSIYRHLRTQSLSPYTIRQLEGSWQVEAKVSARISVARPTDFSSALPRLDQDMSTMIQHPLRPCKLPTHCIQLGIEADQSLASSRCISHHRRPAVSQEASIKSMHIQDVFDLARPVQDQVIKSSQQSVCRSRRPRCSLAQYTHQGSVNANTARSYGSSTTLDIYVYTTPSTSPAVSCTARWSQHAWPGSRNLTWLPPLPSELTRSWLTTRRLLAIAVTRSRLQHPWPGLRNLTWLPSLPSLLARS